MLSSLCSLGKGSPHLSVSSHGIPLGHLGRGERCLVVLVLPGWDSKARGELSWCSQQSEKPVLCSYGPGYSLGSPACKAFREWTKPGVHL